MNFTQARSFVSRKAALDQEPVLTDIEIAEVINEEAAIIDVNDVAPDETGWVPTYDRSGCYRAIAALWDLKAGRSAHRFDFLAPTGGGLFKASQVIDHCEAQARKYRAMVNHSVSTHVE